MLFTGRRLSVGAANRRVKGQSKRALPFVPLTRSAVQPSWMYHNVLLINAERISSSILHVAQASGLIRCGKCAS